MIDQLAGPEDQYLATPLAEVVGRANRAASIVERACGILAESPKRTDALLAYKRARGMAALVARAHLAGRDEMAEAGAQACEQVAAQVVAFDRVRLTGIDPDEAWTEPGADEREVRAVVAERAQAEAQTEACETDPSKRASRGRYNKGCRCEACVRVNRARSRRVRAEGSA